MAKKHEEIQLIPEILNNLGANFLLLEELESAQDYLKLAINSAERASGQIKFSIFNNLGIIFKRKEIIDSALFYYDKTYQVIKSEGNSTLLAQNLNNRGNLLKNAGRYQEALVLYKELERVAIDNNLTFGIFLAQINTSDLYLKLQQPDLAQKYIEAAEKAV